MYATNFSFNGHSSKEYGVVICSFDGETTISGGEVEVSTVLAPNKDIQDYYYTSRPNPITWEFSITKNPCLQSEHDYFTHMEESHIAKWLLGDTGFKELLFEEDDDYRVYYFAYFQMTPHKVAGRTVAYDVTAITNASFGFSQQYTRTDMFKGTDGNAKPIQIMVNNDIKNNIYPVIKIENTSGNFIITNSDINGNIITTSKFSNINGTIFLDCANDLIYGDGFNDPTDFNYIFPKLIDGMNVFTCNVVNDMKFTIGYRENRRVLV